MPKYHTFHQDDIHFSFLFHLLSLFFLFRSLVFRRGGRKEGEEEGRRKIPSNITTATVLFEKRKNIHGPEGACTNTPYSTWTEGSKKDGKVTEAMDVFSAGCVLAELFLEGTALFTLSQLFKYREGELDVDLHLSSIEGEQIRVCSSN